MVEERGQDKGALRERRTGTGSTLTREAARDPVHYVLIAHFGQDDQ